MIFSHDIFSASIVDLRIKTYFADGDIMVIPTKLASNKRNAVIASPNVCNL
jgi:hypothetical protein